MPRGMLIGGKKGSAAKAENMATDAMSMADTAQARADAAMSVANQARSRTMTPGPQGEKGPQGEAGPKGDAGSKGDKGDPGTPADTSAITAIQARASSFGQATVNLSLLAVNATQNVTVTFVRPMPSTSYTAQFTKTDFTGISLANVQVTEGARTVNSITYQVKNVFGLAISGSFVISVNVQGV